jgi:hypothetical protein
MRIFELRIYVRLSSRKQKSVFLGLPFCFPKVENLLTEVRPFLSGVFVNKRCRILFQRMLLNIDIHLMFTDVSASVKGLNWK